MTSASNQARPNRRSARLDVRLSTAERAEIQQAAARHQFVPSAFVRRAALSAARHTDTAPTAGTGAAVQGLTVEQLAILDAARVEVKRVGVLLNQEVRLHHRGVIDLGVLASLVTRVAREHDLMATLLGRQEP
ncbi:hypothetical protein [Cryobacterium sp. TMT3-29-2]|uniref:plasmid mobilization protein n=1 Tax=Cryobacterium sp. TMT3-29-2 TaxID=2555867 RepID=UPI0014321393|nr:hypothetical protein [Cryobacterium sp. TMT3-29-2]